MRYWGSVFNRKREGGFVGTPFPYDEHELILAERVEQAALQPESCIPQQSAGTPRSLVEHARTAQQQRFDSQMGAAHIAAQGVEKGSPNRLGTGPEDWEIDRIALAFAKLQQARTSHLTVTNSA